MEDMIRSLKWALEWQEMSPAKKKETAYRSAVRLAASSPDRLPVEHYEALEMRNSDKQCEKTLREGSELMDLLGSAHMVWAKRQVE